jgi:hypothetical protein
MSTRYISGIEASTDPSMYGSVRNATLALRSGQSSVGTSDGCLADEICLDRPFEGGESWPAPRGGRPTDQLIMTANTDVAGIGPAHRESFDAARLSPTTKDGARRYRHGAEPARSAVVRVRRHVERRVGGHAEVGQRRTVDRHLPDHVTAGDGFAADGDDPLRNGAVDSRRCPQPGGTRRCRRGGVGTHARLRAR